MVSVLWIPSLFCLEMDPHVGIRWEEHNRQTSTAKNIHFNKYHAKVELKFLLTNITENIAAVVLRISFLFSS